jgi:cytochrome b pre-mRNA-processing protein 3
MILASLFRRKSGEDHAGAVYAAIVSAARRPLLYEDYKVADTLEGRFDMVILHAYLVLDRLKTGDLAAQAFAQELTDRIFLEMDHNFREMGVGDLSVGKRVRKLAEIFYGRIGAYALAILEGEAGLAEAFRRNVYPDGVEPAALQGLVHYALAVRKGLAGLDPARIALGQLHYPEVPA